MMGKFLRTGCIFIFFLFQMGSLIYPVCYVKRIKQWPGDSECSGSSV
jgi:hypothetical protein